MKVAALDLGTNSFLCLIAEVNNGVVQKIYDDQVRVVRLGQGVNDSKRFHSEALIRAQACLEEFAAIIEREKPSKILAMATSAAREVENSEALFEICHALKIPIEIIPGDKEAEITFKGATADLPADGKYRLVIDVGGGSTEYIVGKNHEVSFGKSLDIGCVRLTEKMIPFQPTREFDVNKAKEYIKGQLDSIKSQMQKYRIHEVIGVAGTPTALAMIDLEEFDHDKINKVILYASEIQDWVQIFSKLSVEEKMSKYNMEKGRADVILVGTLILGESLKAFNQEKLKVSTKGVRFGVALELALRENN